MPSAANAEPNTSPTNREYGAQFVVMHIGSHRGEGRERGIARLVNGLKAVLRKADRTPTTQSSGAFMPRLVLENSAGMGDAHRGPGA